MVTFLFGSRDANAAKMDPRNAETQTYSVNENETDCATVNTAQEDHSPDTDKFLEEARQEVPEGRIRQTAKLTITLDTLRGYRMTRGCATPRQQRRKKEKNPEPLVKTRLISRTNWEEFCPSSDELRNAICRDHRLAACAFYEAWYFEKMGETRKVLTAKIKEEKMEEERKEQALKEKRLEAECVFLSWKSKKLEELQKVLDRRKKDRSKKKNESEKRLQSKIDAAKVFDAWKMQKDAEYREKLANERIEKAEAEFILEEEKWEKRHEALAMFQAWKRMKDEQIAADSAKRAATEDRGKRTKDLLQKQRDTEALEAYSSWLQKKIDEHRSPRRVRAKSLTYAPWFPPGVAIQY